MVGSNSNQQINLATKCYCWAAIKWISAMSFIYPASSVLESGTFCTFAKYYSVKYPCSTTSATDRSAHRSSFPTPLCFRSYLCSQSTYKTNSYCSALPKSYSSTFSNPPPSAFASCSYSSSNSHCLLTPSFSLTSSLFVLSFLWPSAPSACKPSASLPSPRSPVTSCPLIYPLHF